jgi:hypothetical protein
MTADDEVDRQIRALVGIIGGIADSVAALSGRVDRLASTMESGLSDDCPTVPWLLSSPDMATADPAQFLVGFVDYYNATFSGQSGRPNPIPACWRKHPGLVAEVPALAYAWRAANQSRSANIRDAEQWLHQWRPGFVDRMARDWVPADCFDSCHVDMVNRRP